MLHLDSIAFPYSTVYSLTVRQDVENGSGLERELIFNASRSRGCAFTVNSVGNYSIFFRSVSPESNGRLEHDGMAVFAASGDFDNFYSNVQGVLPALTGTSSADMTRTPSEDVTPVTCTSSEQIIATSGEPVTRTSTDEVTATSGEPVTRTSSDEVTATSGEPVTRTSSEQVTPTSSREPVHSPASEGGAINPALIAVPTLVLLILVVIVAVWFWRRHRRLEGVDYQSMSDSSFPVHRDSLSDYDAPI
jgi:hypothetical protein